MRQAKMSTYVTHTGVSYAVQDEHGEVIRQKFMYFGRTPEFRAGGSAFKEVAKEQEAVAKRYIETGEV